jgi:hypothetical protein
MMKTPDKKNSQSVHDEQAGYEKKDVNLRVVLAVCLATVFLLVVFVIGLNEYFLVASEKQLQKDVLEPESVALRNLRASEDEMLNRYRVIDSNKGVYAVPIERAMELIAKEAFAAKGPQK